MLNYLLYRLGEFIALSLPLKLSYALAVFLSDVRYLFAFSDRRRVRENLKAIFPDKPEKEIRTIRRKIFRNFAKYLVDFFRFSLIDKEYLKKMVKVQNLEYVDAALKAGRGVVLLTAHLGNWELGGVVIALYGYPLWVVALPHKDRRVNDFFDLRRKSKGVRIIPLGRAARQSLNILQNNQLLALAGDRDFTEQGVRIDFFGKTTIFPQGPAAFSLKLGTPIVPGFMIRNADDTFTLRFEKAVEYSLGGDKKTDRLELIAKYKLVIEDFIRRYPDQWYMFRKFWVE